jgi:ferrous iron transport protein B
MRFVLIGQPNCGKSTLFNQVAGYRAETGNFPGTTVTLIESKVRVLGDIIELVDLPGTYTLAGTNPAERVTFDYLVNNQVDLIINIIDATRLMEGLSLTLELLELKKPLIVGLNMMDEAVRLGIEIDGKKLQQILGVPVLPLIARKGRGVRDLFTSAYKVARNQLVPHRVKYMKIVEDAIDELKLQFDENQYSLNLDALAIKLLEGDKLWLERVVEKQPEINEKVEAIRLKLQEKREQPIDWVISSERHSLAANISRNVVHQGERRLSIRDRLDDVLLNPILGYISLVIILLIFFEVVYGVGSLLEKPLTNVFTNLSIEVEAIFGTTSLIATIINGLVMGIAGGVAIVIPYLTPFLMGLGFLEDIGYLPRIAFLMDALMHKIGLHGRAIVPFILGYGCNVPAVMSTRILEDKRDRFLAAALSTMIPCSARIAVVFGLVAFYLGPEVALAIYVFNILVIAVTGHFLSKLLPEDTPGMILEMPVYRIPTLKTILHKTWFRLREFIIDAWPILIAGSIVLSLLNYFDLSKFINMMTRPITYILGLPFEVGIPLIFGILRKELSLIMLQQALGGTNFSLLLTPVQMITFAVFVVFYVPCLATLAVLKKELGTKDMLIIALLTVVVALIAALVARFISSIVYIG